MKKIFTLCFAAMASLSATAQLQGAMENWRTYNTGIFPPVQCEAPATWFGLDSLVIFGGQLIGPGGTYVKQIFKSTDAHSGSFAARLDTKSQDTLGMVPGILANVKFEVTGIPDPNDPFASLSYTGGTFVSTRVPSLDAWVKYTPVGGDSAGLQVLAVLDGASTTGEDSVVGEGFLIIPQAITSYVNVNIPIDYVDPNVVPNKLVIIAISSINEVIHDGSMLFLDDVTFSGLSVKNTVAKAQQVKVYPNPVANTLHLTTSLNGAHTFSAYNLIGQQVATQTFTGTATVDVSALAQGSYIYTISNAQGEAVQHAQFTIVK